MTHAFIEQRFPEDISYGSTGGPEYSTNVLTTVSGHEKRNINWAAARGRYNVIHGVKTKEQMDRLLSFFRNCYGKATGFRFKDWSDYKADQQFLDIADGVTTEFQLVKTYQLGDNVVSRKITKPVHNSVQLYASGQKHYLRGTDSTYFLHGFSIDHTTGLITFTTPPASGEKIYANFEFDVPARFDTDLLSAHLDDYGIHSWRDIAIIEIKL